MSQRSMGLCTRCTHANVFHVYVDKSSLCSVKLVYMYSVIIWCYLSWTCFQRVAARHSSGGSKTACSAFLSFQIEHCFIGVSKVKRNYNMSAIITHYWLQTALEYEPYIKNKDTVWTVNDVLSQSIPLELSRFIPFYWVDPSRASKVEDPSR